VEEEIIQKDQSSGSLARIRQTLQDEYDANIGGQGDREVDNYLGGLQFALGAVSAEQELSMAHPETGDPLGTVTITGTREEFYALDGINVDGQLYMKAEWVKEKSVETFVRMMYKRIDGLSTLEELHALQAQVQENMARYAFDEVTARAQQPPQAS
jgi:hypothetical protein